MNGYYSVYYFNIIFKCALLIQIPRAATAYSLYIYNINNCYYLFQTKFQMIRILKTVRQIEKSGKQMIQTKYIEMILACLHTIAMLNLIRQKFLLFLYSVIISKYMKHCLPNCNILPEEKYIFPVIYLFNLLIYFSIITFTITNICDLYNNSPLIHASNTYYHGNAYCI